MTDPAQPIAAGIEDLTTPQSVLGEGEFHPADLRAVYAADLFAWSGVALYALFLLLGLTTSVPLRLLDPAWQQRVIQALVANALFPVIGTCLLVLAGILDPEVQPGQRWLELFRRLAWIPVLGYLLLIPLQASATLRLDANAVRPLDAEIHQLQRAIVEVRRAGSLADVGATLKKLPGSPTIPRGFDLPLAGFRTQVLETLERNNANLTGLRERQAAERRLPQVIGLLHTTLSCLILTAVFAVAARPSDERPSLLQRVLRRGLPDPRPASNRRAGRDDLAFIEAMLAPEQEP